MKHWPYLSIVASLLAGMLASKLLATSPSDAKDFVSVEAKEQSVTPLLISPRRPARGALPAHVLDKVRFEPMEDGKVTLIARHLLELTESDCTVIESALLEREVAEVELDRQLALKAAITEQTAESVVIDLPNDAEARHTISLGCWETVSDIVGANWTTKMLGDRPHSPPGNPRRRQLTMQQSGDAEVHEFTDVDGRQFNSSRSMMARGDLSGPWPGILKRLDL